uniref:TNase-like domain-containing protein n=1 Tax=uncultured Nocardioidaceae bacterium TaxID=253824 RepID=A0A6J4M8G5_9ACTN|nr:MAG: hypothetical protein AVDCRST_MAG46-2628 [uncultured Nocardioidaceae bacterium]
MATADRTGVGRLLAVLIAALAMVSTSCAQEATTQSGAIETSPEGEPATSEGAPSSHEPMEGASQTPPPESAPSDQPTDAPVRLYLVVDLVDGDTVEVRHNGRVVAVDVLGIDAPETAISNTPGQCWGQQASAAARRLLVGKEVSLHVDRSPGRSGTYDRMLRYITIPGSGDFGTLMIEAGHAIKHADDGPYARETAYSRVETEARHDDRGLWHACGGMVPEPESEPDLDEEPEIPIHVGCEVACPERRQ